MVVIPQHGNNGEIFDISNFLADVDLFIKPDSWHITIYWCTGERALEIERLTATGQTFTDADFRAMYRGIYQTIDGNFVGSANGERVFEYLHLTPRTGK